MCFFSKPKATSTTPVSVVPDSNEAGTAAREERIRRQGAEGLGASVLSRGAGAVTPAGAKTVLGA